MEQEQGQCQEIQRRPVPSIRVRPGKAAYKAGRNGTHEGSRDDDEEDQLGGIVEEGDRIERKSNHGIDGDAGKATTRPHPEGQALNNDEEGDED